MKTIPTIRKWRRSALVFVSFLLLSSCMSTKVIGSQHSENLDNEECQTVSQWKYWWGIGGSDEILVEPDSPDTVCPCIDGKLASVEVNSSFGDFLLTLVTVGIVNHRTVHFECAEIDEGEQN
ncbi:MAG: hypothetical protein AAFP76_08525 [Bacteroidota bacterium]